jgi:hypothetical protein
LSLAQADRNEYIFTVPLIYLGRAGYIVDEAAVFLYCFKPGERLLIGPLHNLAAAVHAVLKLFQ